MARNEIMSILKWQEANFNLKSAFSRKCDVLFKFSAYLFWSNEVQWEIALQKGQRRANSLRTMLRPLCTPYTQFRNFCVCVCPPMRLGISLSCHCLAFFLSTVLQPLLLSCLRSFWRKELTVTIGTTKPSFVIDNQYDDPFLVNTQKFFFILDFI